jgi:hypothetical protein
VLDRDQLIQQQHRIGQAALQASPGGTLCVHCAHREQREIAIITKERQLAAEQVHSAVAGVVQEREGLREQVRTYVNIVSYTAGSASEELCYFSMKFDRV